MFTCEQGRGSCSRTKLLADLLQSLEVGDAIYYIDHIAPRSTDSSLHCERQILYGEK